MNRTSTTAHRDRTAIPPAPHPFGALSTPLATTKTVLVCADQTAADPVAAKREELRRAFHQTCEIY